MLQKCYHHLLFLLFSMRHYAVNWCNELRFCIYLPITYLQQPAICGTNLQLLQPAGIRLTHWQNVLKIHKYCRNYRVYFCPSAHDNSSSGVNNSSLRTQKGIFLGPDLIYTALYSGNGIHQTHLGIISLMFIAVSRPNSMAEFSIENSTGASI